MYLHTSMGDAPPCLPPGGGLYEVWFVDRASGQVVCENVVAKNETEAVLRCWEQLTETGELVHTVDSYEHVVRYVAPLRFS